MTRRNALRSIAAFAILTLAAACADSSTVRDAAPDAGIDAKFNRPYDAVSAATLDSLRTLNIRVTSTEETPAGLVVLITKPVSAFSWGEVGRVTVLRSAQPPTSVRVYWEKRSQLQLTGTGQSEAASQIFAGIDQALALLK